jgi:hypothetical protein
VIEFVKSKRRTDRTFSYKKMAEFMNFIKFPTPTGKLWTARNLYYHKSQQSKNTQKTYEVPKQDASNLSLQSGSSSGNSNAVTKPILATAEVSDLLSFFQPYLNRFPRHIRDKAIRQLLGASNND